MVAATILKNPKSRYLGNGLTDRHEIWHGYAYWPSEQVRHLQFPTFKNQRWRTAAILKNPKKPYLGNASTDRHNIRHDDALALRTGPAGEITNFQNPIWRTAAGPTFKRGKEGKIGE